ncbi:spore germination protein [Salicibibacter cibi]|uniref:Spore germination protein n=1 Tax=Salicibibacter cibi TaxID=2743001 RepID=A0A7T7CET2_9BACI|nr:spore germination protein [Salicibibacter cibi]QQK79397.1 spore germination protein [Salicibibacter cibi]
MLKLLKKRFQKRNNGWPPTPTITSYEQFFPLSNDMKENATYINEQFGESSDVNIHPFQFPLNENEYIEALLVYIDAFIDDHSVSRYILEPIKASNAFTLNDESSMTTIKNRINVSESKEETDLNRCIDEVLHHQALLMIDGASTGLLMNVSGFEKRSLEEPYTETSVKGPHIGFIESIEDNLALLRRHIQHPALRVHMLQLGTLSQTKVAITYINGIVKPGIIAEVNKRLQNIDVDSVNNAGHLEQMIEDHPYTIFPTIANSERPDRTAMQLLDGHFAIFVDGDPITLVAPNLFMEAFHGVEDYSSRPYYASFVRLLRIGGFLISITLPASFIAAVNFHKEIIPSEMISGMSASREVVPFPVGMEIFIMIILFEIVREAGIRMPQPIGQAVSIVGALIVGEVSVTAGLVGAPTIIVVAVSVLASFAITRVADVMGILRLALLLPAGLFGAYGLLLSLLGLLTHMFTLQSFGVGYMSPLAPFHFRDWGDTFIRLPIQWRRKRPQSIPHEKKEKIKRLPIDDKGDRP